MSVPIRIDESIYNAAKQIAKSEFRSISHQIELWATLGKCALENPDLPIDFIKEILASRHQDRTLKETFNFE